MLVSKLGVSRQLIPIKVNKTLKGDGRTFSNHTFPSEELVMVSTQEYGRDSDGKPNTYYMYYSYMGVQTAVVVPKDWKFAKMRGKKAEKLMEEYRKIAATKIPQNLNHGGIISTLGSDPEIFVETKDKAILPAFEFLGSKEAPTVGPKAGDGSPYECGNQKIYWDGFQAEFTTYAPSCIGWLCDSIQTGLKGVLEAAKAKDKNAKLSPQTLVEIPYSVLQEAKQEHVDFGCMPSFNAYGMSGQLGDGRNTIFRSAGGHIHFGCGKMTEKQAAPIVKALDMIIGVACVSLFAKYDNPARRVMYGLAGEYRLPKHGIEYRTLSNAWLFHPLITNVVLDMSRKAFMFGFQGFHKHWDATEAETIHVINTCDVEGARAILKRNEHMFKQLVTAAYGTYGGPADVVFNMFLNGMESVITNPEDIGGNWNLESKWTAHSNGVGKAFHNSREIIASGKKVA